MTIHETVKELDAGPIAAQRAFPLTPEDDAGTVYARAAELAVELLDEVLPEPSFTPQAGEATYAAKIGAADRELDLSRPEESLNRIRALSPHIGARGELHGRRVTIWKARLEDGELVPRRGAAGGRQSGCRYDAFLRGAAVTIAPARLAAYEVVRRVFEEGAYADRALRSASERLDDRDRSLARQLAFGTVQRLRTLDHAIETLGKRPVRKLDPPVLAALRLGAFQLGFLGGVPRYAAVNESVELVRRARLERAVPFTNAVLRRVGDGIELLLAELPEGPLKHSYPDWIWDVWRRDLGEEAALALMRAQNEPPPVVVRHVRGESPDGSRTDIPGAYEVARVDEKALERGEIWPQSRGSQLAGLVVGSQDGRARPRPLRCAGRQDDDARGRGDRRRGERGSRARARGERSPARRDQRHRRPRRRPRPAGRADRLRPRARRRALLRARRARRPPRPALALAAAARAPARAAARRRRARAPRRDDRLLRLHDQRGRVRGGRRRVRACDRADRRLAAVPPPEPAGVPADAAARPRHERLLHRPPPHGRGTGP